MTLKQLRTQKKLTQAACAAYLGVPLRTYQNYENDEQKQASIKYQFMLQKLIFYGSLLLLNTASLMRPMAFSV